MRLLTLPIRRVIFLFTSSQTYFPPHEHLEPCGGSSGVMCPVGNLSTDTDKDTVLQPLSSGGS